MWQGVDGGIQRILSLAKPYWVRVHLGETHLGVVLRRAPFRMEIIKLFKLIHLIF